MSQELLPFRASGSSWAIPLSDVLEILESPPLIRLPLLPESTPGIIDVRGRAVPAIDLRGTTSGAGSSQVENGRAAILAERGVRRIALLVDSVDDIGEVMPVETNVIDLGSLFATLDAEGRIS